MSLLYASNRDKIQQQQKELFLFVFSSVGIFFVVGLFKICTSIEKKHKKNQRLHYNICHKYCCFVLGSWGWF